MTDEEVRQQEERTDAFIAAFREFDRVHHRRSDKLNEAPSSRSRA
jgi:hypothetical protein